MSVQCLVHNAQYAVLKNLQCTKKQEKFTIGVKVIH